MLAGTRPEVASFYHLGGGLPRLCRGTACFVARHRDPDRWAAALAQDPPLYCLGHCHLAPAALEDDGQPRIEVSAPRAVLLERADVGATTLERYGGYTALEQAKRIPRETLVESIEASGLRGRGGAAFPTGRKWRAIVAQPDPTRFVVVNADEGDPGAYSDRILLERDPHATIEGLAIAAHAIGARRAFLYLRREYPRAERVLHAALAEARPLLGRELGLEIELVVGAGSYVCGEETSLLESIEGKRPMVRARPPYPTERGLHGKPTLVQNVETLANVPWIVRHGAAAYAALGHSNSRGTKLVSLNSLFRRPGLYEVELGTPVRRIVEELGGGLADGRLAGVLIGGPLAGILPPALLDTPFAFEELRAVGASVGHGGIVAFDQRTSVVDLLLHAFEFGAFESCGKCTPCRLGSRRVVEMLSVPSRHRQAEVAEVVSALRLTSLCGLGSGLAELADSVSRYYPEELARCLA
jgi:NADH:ubiquinone oxidoreductase subunit F (NADH-binding)